MCSFFGENSFFFFLSGEKEISVIQQLKISVPENRLSQTYHAAKDCHSALYLGFMTRIHSLGFFHLKLIQQIYSKGLF